MDRYLNIVNNTLDNIENFTNINSYKKLLTQIDDLPTSERNKNKEHIDILVDLINRLESCTPKGSSLSYIQHYALIKALGSIFTNFDVSTHIGRLPEDKTLLVEHKQNQHCKLNKEEEMYSVIYDLKDNINKNVLSSQISAFIFDYLTISNMLLEDNDFYYDIVDAVNKVLTDNKWTNPSDKTAGGFLSEPNINNISKGLDHVLQYYFQ